MHDLDKIINEYKNFKQVCAIAIGGSGAAKTCDKMSDIDLYVFTDKNIPVKDREIIVKKYSSKYEVGGEYFGQGDEYMVDKLNKQLDVMFWEKDWFEHSISNVWEKYYPSNGYTTCFLYTLKNFNIKYDTDNWLANLQKKLNKSYPKQLKENIIKRNLMLIKDKPFASYYKQIEKAIIREDINSVNHRVSAFLASYFDIIFAKNEILHPGEKRLIKFATENCKYLPEKFEENLSKLLKEPDEKKLNTLNEIIENLRKII